MTYNKRKNAALLSRLLSSFKSMIVIAEREHTYNYMLKFVASFLLLITSFGSFGQTGFPAIGDGSACTGPIPICGDMIGSIAGTLPTANLNPPFDDLCALGSIENAVWYQFIACEAIVEIEICPIDCTMGLGGTGMQASIAENCDPSSSVVCSTNPINTCFTLTSSDFTPGQLYLLVVDGYGGSECDYEINVISGIHDDNYTLSTDLPNEISHSPIDNCVEKGVNVSFSVPECMAEGGACALPSLFNNNYIYYEWVFDPPTVQFIGDSTIPYVDVEFCEEGTYTVNVIRNIHPFLEECSEGACDNPPQITFEINFIDTIFNGTQIICPGETVNICGSPVGIDGVYDCFDEATCTVTIDTLAFPSLVEVDLGTIILCSEECFEFESVEYCDRESYTVESIESCDTIYEFVLQDLFISINEPATYPIVDCNGIPQFMDISVSTNYLSGLSYSYVDPLGIEISTQTFANVSIAGEYTFYVFSPEFPTTCIDSLVFTIEANDTLPEFSVNAEVLTCTDREASLGVVAIDEIESFTWTGPAVTNPKDPSAFASELGTYYIEVVGENGCIGIDSIVVTEELLPAEIDIDFDTLSCELAMTTLAIISDVAIDSVIWTGPSDWGSKMLEPIVTDTGTYVASLFAENGCNYSEIINVLGSFVEPSMDISQSVIWDCETESVFLDATLTSGSAGSFDWFTESGEIVSGQGTSQIEVGSTGVYFLEVTDANNGCSNIDTVEIEVDPNIPSSVSVEKIEPSCFGENDGSLEVIDIVGGVGPFTFIVNEEMTEDQLIENLGAGTYNFTLVDVNGCELERTIELVDPLEIQAEIDAPEMATYQDVIELTSIFDDQLFDIDQVNWYDSEGTFLGVGVNINFTILQNETITMEVIDVNGCTVIKTRSIILDEDYDYYQPTVFTPNGDGINDNFLVFSQNIPGEILEFAVYDRWGNRVYQLEGNVVLPTTDTTWGWNGTHNGTGAAAGVYVYYVVVETLGVTKELKGSVTLVR